MQREVVKRYVELLTGDPETPLHWRAVHDKDKSYSAIKLYGPLSEVADELTELNADGYGVFAVINEGGDSAPEITRVRAVYVDGDNIPPPETWLVKPDFMVVRDDTHWHAYWLVDDLPTEDFTQFQKRLIRYYGTDPIVHDLPRVLRIPGFYHNKSEPKMVRLEDTGVDRWELGHPRAVLEAGLPQIAAVVKQAAPANVEEDSQLGIERAKAWLRDAVRQGNVSIQGHEGDATAYAHAAKLYNDFALSKEKTLDLMNELYNPYCIPHWQSDELGVKIENASAYHDESRPRGCGLLGAAETFGSAIPKVTEAGPKRPPGKPRFYAYDEDDQDDMPEPEWLLQDLLPAESVGMFYGPTQSYKSFLALDIALSLSYGIETFGIQPASRYDVVYVAGEGPRSIARRRRPAWKVAREVVGKSRFFIVKNMPLVADTSLFAEFAAQLRSQGIKPKLVVLDTASRALTGLNENDAAVMTTLIAECENLRDEFGCTVLLIHHTGKDLSKGARGNSAAEAGLDFAGVVSANRETKAVALKMTKMKDEEVRGEPWTFQGKVIGRSLVFFRTTPQEHAQLARSTPTLDRPTVGAALTTLGAIGAINGVTRFALADVLTPQVQIHSAEERKSAVAATARALKTLGKDHLLGYHETIDSDDVWFLPDQSLPPQ